MNDEGQYMTFKLWVVKDVTFQSWMMLFSINEYLVGNSLQSPVLALDILHPALWSYKNGKIEFMSLNC